MEEIEQQEQAAGELSTEIISPVQDMPVKQKWRVVAKKTIVGNLADYTRELLKWGREGFVQTRYAKDWPTALHGGLYMTTVYRFELPQEDVTEMSEFKKEMAGQVAAARAEWADHKEKKAAARGRPKKAVAPAGA
jgi:hypothetical protein